MDRCKVCGVYFDRGTSMLPSNYCNDCLRYVKYVVAKQTNAEQIKYYIDLINTCQEEIYDCKEKISKNTEIIKYAKEQININHID